MKYVEIEVSTNSNVEFVNITEKIRRVVEDGRADDGLCHIYVPHTTAAVTINEAADPSVVRDIVKEINKVIPFSDGYSHMEGNSAAHIKASLIGPSISVPLNRGKLMLGTWQGIFFCEFDGPRSRRVGLQFPAEM